MKFSKEFLQEQDYTLVRGEIVDQRRWVTVYEHIFEHEGKLYQTCFEQGSTEQQDTRPYEYEEDMIECPEMIAITRAVIVYVTAESLK